MEHISVLLVCMGNICRSPMAEAALRHQLDDAGLADRVRVDSAGTHSYHLGNAPHEETQAELARRGVDVGDQRSRLVTAADLESFDLVVAMDRANLEQLRALAHEAGGEDAAHAALSLLLDHARETVDVDEVPDPYYVGGYEGVYDLVDIGCRGLVDVIEARLHGRARSSPRPPDPH